MSNGLNNDYENRLLGDGGTEEFEEFEPEKVSSGDSEEYYDLPPAIRSRTLIWAVISFTAGILSLALSSFYYVGFAFAAASVIMSLVSRRNLGFFERYSIMGLVFGIMGFVFSLFALITGTLGLF